GAFLPSCGLPRELKGGDGDRRAAPDVRILKEAFERVGLPYFHPHSFRHTVARFGEQMNLTPDQWKAYSQNFGHSSPMTTFTSYESVAAHRHTEIMNALAAKPASIADQAAQPVRLDDRQLGMLMELLNRL